jgi:hypothetical protein
MNLLRVFRHGPLVFWSAALLLLGSVSIYSLTNKMPSETSTQYENSAWTEVETWRLSLSQLPLLVNGGDIDGFASKLEEKALYNADKSTDSGMTSLALAWKDAALSASSLKKADESDSGSLQAAIRRVGLSGDRLLAVVSGSDWIPATAPSRLDIVSSTSPDEQDRLSE